MMVVPLLKHEGRLPKFIAASLLSGALSCPACTGNSTVPIQSSQPMTQTFPAAKLPLSFTTPSPLPSANVFANIPSPPTVAASYSSSQYPVSIQFKIPLSSESKRKAEYRSLQYISASNTKISVVVTPLGGGATTYGPNACTTGSCAITFTASPGSNNLVFNLADVSNTVLSTYSTMIIVLPVPLNTYSFSANPIVNSVDVQLGSSTVSAGSTGTLPLTINARDPDGNIIVGSDNYVNASGTPIALTISVQSIQDYGNGVVSLQGPTKLTSSSHAALSLAYNGGWFSSSNISVTAYPSITGTLSAATLASVGSNNITYTLITSGSYPNRITLGADGNLWVSEQVTDKIAKLSIHGNITEYPVSTISAGPLGMTLGPDGNVWFTEGNTNKVSSITPSGTITEYTTPTAGSHPNDITTGPDGNIWFTEYSKNKIGTITANGNITEFSVPGPQYQPHFITAGSDGNIWFTQDSNSIGRISTSGTIAQFTIPTASSLPQGITVGPDGNVWFVEWNGNKVGKITPSGTITEYTIPTTSASPFEIVSGPDGLLWFTEYNSSKIGSITTNGTINDYLTNPCCMSPAGLAFGPDNNIWFVENGFNKISRFVY